MNADHLIESLSRDLHNVPPLPHPAWRAALWAGGGFLYLVGFAVLVHIRPDVWTMLSDIGSLMEIFFSLALFISGALASAWLSIPDKRGRPWIGILPLVFAIGFALWLAGRTAVDPAGLMPHLELHHCVGTCLLAGFGPALLIGWGSRKGATTAPLLMAFANIVFVTGIGLIGLKFTCGDDSIGHMLLMHLGPFILAGFFIGLLARRLYRW